MIASIVFGVLVVAFLVLAYLGAKTWPVMHVVLLTSLFLASIGFVFLSAMSLRTRDEWGSLYSQRSKELNTAMDRLADLEYGTEDLPDGTKGLSGNVRLLNELGRALIDRGRVWRGAIPNGIANNSLTIDLAEWGKNPCAGVAEEDADLEPIAEEAAEGAAPAMIPHGMEVNQVLYLFQETSISKLNELQRRTLFGESDLPTRDPDGHCKLPSFYLGEYQVTEVNGSNVTLVPLRPLDLQQQQHITSQQGTWAVYDILPIDDPDIFSDVEAEGLVSLIADASLEDVQDFIRHGKKAELSDAPEHTLIAVKFLKDHTVEVDDPNADMGADTSFGPSGRAQVPTLRQGQDTSFKAGDRAMFDGITARQLKDRGIVEQLDEPPIFRRPLKDYAFMFKQKQVDLDRLAREMAIFEADNRSLMNAATAVNAEITYRENERTLLQSDLQKFRDELQRTTAYRAQLQAKRDRQRQILSSLYRKNDSLTRQLQGRSGDSEAMLGTK